jgi:probable O-glycosylation ligase (exosortase A-associated)
MRSLALIACLLAMFPLTFVAPQVGVLIWSWLSFMSPQQLVYFPIPVPLVYVVALTTMGAWFFSREPKRLPANAMPWLVMLFAVDMTISSAFGISPELAWSLWNRNVKTMILTLAIMLIMTNRVRLQALVWVIVVSIGYFAVKGGIFVLVTGGSSQVLGPPGSMIPDNNQVGLAMVMVWPLMFYLRASSEDRWVRLGLSLAMLLSVFAILGTYSRGAFVAFSFLIVYFWLKSKKKFLFAAIGLCTIAPALLFMPQQWIARMQTINTYNADLSAESRLESWGMAIRIAEARPFTGIGFDAMKLPLANQLFDPDRERGFVAHSIWFEPLSDHGLPGLIIFVAIGALGFFQANAVRRATRSIPEWEWAHNLATMSQLSLAGYFAAGTFLSMPYYDVYYAIIGIVSVLRAMVAQAARDESAGRVEQLSHVVARRTRQPAAFARVVNFDQKIIES